MLPNETFTSFVEEKFPNWDDDAEMLQTLLSTLLSKPLPSTSRKSSVQKNGISRKTSLKTTYDKKEVAFDYIKPKLKNWDPQRIAILDMLLMRLGVCDSFSFKPSRQKLPLTNISTWLKNTVRNRADNSSTVYSDNIHKELVKDDKMHKVSFKQP